MAKDHENYEYIIPVEIGVEFAVPKKPGWNLYGQNPIGYLPGQKKAMGIKYTPEEIQILGKSGLTEQIHLLKSVFEGEIISHEKIDRVKELYK